MVRSCFVSHSTKDRYFVNLLVEILRFHGVKAWVSHELAGGQRWQEELDGAIRRAECLLVVVSRHARDSDWVLKEITRYCAARPGAPVVPICLDTTDLVQVDEELAGFQAVDFHSDMNAGFKKLLKDTFGCTFLPEGAFVVRDRRAEGGDRRAPVDRRQAAALMRLRTGFWDAYHAGTGMEKLEPVEVKVSRVYKMRDMLLGEVQRLVFTDGRGEKVSAKDALDAGIASLLEELSGRTLPAVHMVEAVAEEICSQFEIGSSSDRRRRDRRQPQATPP